MSRRSAALFLTKLKRFDRRDWAGLIAALAAASLPFVLPVLELVP
jgi:hypothetical protein